MKKYILIALILLVTLFTNAQIISIGDDSDITIYQGDEILMSNGVGTGKIIFPSSDLVFPPDAYFLSPDVNGNFTKAMVDNAYALGEDYIVFDAPTLDVYYADAPHLVGNDSRPVYLHLENIKGTEQNQITLDFRKVYINCFPNPNDILQKHIVFNFEYCENINLKLGTTEGTKYKRDFLTDDETYFENTVLVRADSGTKNLVIDGGTTAGFMADMQSSVVTGKASIDTAPLEKDFYVQGDGRYESRFYDVDPITYPTFGLTGGLGYNRLLHYDMEDVIFKFYDASEVFISEIPAAQYYITYTFPVTARKMKVNVNPMDGRIESPTNFGHKLEYEPNTGTVVKNMRIGDHHRGGIANIGANAVIDNNVFYSSQRYWDTPKFGIGTNASTTTYHINCEDAVSRNLIISNNLFEDKFHRILLTHNINVDITDNIFPVGDYYSYNISIYDLMYGTFSGNVFNGQVTGGEGTNTSQVLITNNTGACQVQLTSGAEWINNNFIGGDLSGKGKLSGNTFIDASYAHAEFTKEMQGNTWTGEPFVQYVYENAYIYNNTFTDTGFRFQHGDLSNTVFLDNITVDFSATPINEALYRSSIQTKVVAVNSTFKDVKIHHRTINKGVDYVDGDWYFENCPFEDITDYIIKLNVNSVNTVPINFYFKNCPFTGSGDFIDVVSTGNNYNIVFDNCTIDPNITMPPNYTLGTVTMPTLIEPRTQPIPAITYNVDRTEIAVLFHNFSLKIRNKNTLEIVLDRLVSSTYKHYNLTPNDFEYSIDGGVYWDSI